MRPYEKDGEVCFPKSITRRQQMDTGYLFIQGDKVVRYAPLKDYDYCVKPSSDEAYVVAMLRTSSRKGIILLIYKYNSQAEKKLNVLSSFDNMRDTDGLKELLKSLGVSENAINVVMSEVV